jgi:hypothetical protein
MGKKIAVILLITSWLFLTYTTIAMAGYKSVNLEYIANEDNDDGSKVGFSWGNNKWRGFMGHKLTGSDDDYLGLGYTFLSKLYLGTKYDASDDADSVSFSTSINQPLMKSLSLSGEASYTDYNSKIWKDFSELTLRGGLQWQIKQNFNVSTYLYSTKKDVDYDVKNYNVDTFGRSVGFWYRVNQPFSIWGNYRFIDYDYEDQSMDSNSTKAFALGATYNFKKYSIYMTYDNNVEKLTAGAPTKKTTSTVFGVSYNF